MKGIKYLILLLSIFGIMNFETIEVGGDLETTDVVQIEVVEIN